MGGLISSANLLSQLVLQRQVIVARIRRHRLRFMRWKMLLVKECPNFLYLSNNDKEKQITCVTRIYFI